MTEKNMISIRVLAFLFFTGTPFTSKEISIQLRIKRLKINRTIQHLRATGRIKDLGLGGSGHISRLIITPEGVDYINQVKKEALETLEIVRGYEWL